MYKIIYFGSDYRIVEYLQQNFDIKYIICEHKQFNKNICNFALKKNIIIKFVKKLNDISNNWLNNCDFGISFGFGVIFNRNIIDKFKHGILNIHPGKLPDYRGRQPISWAIINNEESIWLSIHKVNEKIDMGVLLFEKEIPIKLEDDDSKMYSKCVETILNINFNEIVRKKGSSVQSEGTYYPNLANYKHTINTKEMTAIEIYSIVRSQFLHGGVSYKNKFIVECNYCPEGQEDMFSEYEIIKSKDNIKLAVKIKK